MSEFNQLLSFDALSTAEKLTGKSYKEDEATMRMGFAMHLLNGECKRNELALRDDTVHSNPWSHTLKVYADLGFETVYAKAFRGRYGTEEFEVLWRSDGLLAKVESFTLAGRVSTNHSDLYYNWRPNPEVDRWEYTSSGHCHTPSYDQGDHVWIGHHDVREAMRHKIAQLEAHGEFLTPWVERPFLWLLTYMDTKDPDYDHKAITASVIAELPEHVRKAITP